MRLRKGKKSFRSQRFKVLLGFVFSFEFNVYNIYIYIIYANIRIHILVIQWNVSWKTILCTLTALVFFVLMLPSFSRGVVYAAQLASLSIPTLVT